VKYEVLPAVFDVREAVRKVRRSFTTSQMPTAFTTANYNIAAHYDVEIGKVDQGLKEADFIVEEEFETQYAQHCPLEPHICIGYLDENTASCCARRRRCRGIVAASSRNACRFPSARSRVIKTTYRRRVWRQAGDYSRRFVRVDHLRTRRPVKIEMTRREEFIASRTRDPSIVK